MPSTTKAKRGDLVAVVIERKTFTINPPTTKTHTNVELRTVSSITREGAIKATTDYHGSSIQRDREAYNNPTYLVIPAHTVDGPALIEAYKAHTWWADSTQVKPFDSVDECKAFVRPFLVGEKVPA